MAHLLRKRPSSRLPAKQTRSKFIAKLGMVGTQPGTGVSSSRLISLRHHPSVWLAPAALLLLAILPWPYGYFNFLRLAVSILAGWLAYEQWKLDDAVSGWVVALGGVALLYNPVLPVHLTREIWGAINLLTAFLFLSHLALLRRMILEPPAPQAGISTSTLRTLSTSRTPRTPARNRKSTL